jgi:5-methylcytosine-specific restriction enzyme subunit McrC
MSDDQNAGPNKPQSAKASRTVSRAPPPSPRIQASGWSPPKPNVQADHLKKLQDALWQCEVLIRAARDETFGPRGRLRLDRMAKEATELRGTAVCDFDELNHDVLINQVLKGTLTHLANCVDVELVTRHELRSLAKRFYDVEAIRLSASHFRRITISRNSREYVFLIRLCELIFWSLMPDEEGAETRFQLLDDEVRMSAVFQDFLCNFFQFHHTEYRVKSESLRWYVTDATQNDLSLLPRMVTDITLRHPGHTIIVEAKFYGKALAQGPYGERVWSQHLYQLVTYLQHEHIRQPDTKLCGMLVYPNVGRSLRLRYRLLNVPVLVATVDLGQEWLKIEAELHGLLDDCATAANLPAGHALSAQRVSS